MKPKRHHPPTSISIPLLFTFLTLFNHAAKAAFAPIFDSPNYQSWSWAAVETDRTKAPLTNAPAIPSDLIYRKFTIWSSSFRAPGDGLRLHAVNPPFTSGFDHALYKTMTFMIYPTGTVSTDGLTMYAVGKVPNDQTPANTKSLFDLRGGTSLVPDQWNNVTVNMKDYYYALAAQGSNRLPWADIIIQCAVAQCDGSSIFIFGYMGDLSEYVLPTPYVEAPWVDPMTGQETLIATGTLKFLDVDTPADPDTGVNPQWACVGTNLRGYKQLAGIPLTAWRDTTTGPVRMNLSYGIHYEEMDLKIESMWLRNQANNMITFNGFDYPHPAYACMVFNGDFYIIGNQNARVEDTLYVWLPFRDSNMNLYLAAFAEYVRLKKVAGEDVTVYVRQQFAPFKNGFDKGFAAVAKNDVNCTKEAEPWMCPDIIFFSDAEIGVLKEQKDMLQPLTEPILKYFRNTGFEPSMDMEAVVRSLVYYNNIPYALPAHVWSRGWGVNKKTLNTAGLRLPPPLEDWGSAWWKEWNMKEFNRYLQVLYDSGKRNLFILPPFEGTQTVLAAKMSLLWGGSMFTADGRCGMDDKTERALNETIVFWKSNPGMLYPLVPVNATEFQKWIDEPLQKDPIYAWRPILNHPVWGGGIGYRTVGFDEYHCTNPDGDCVEIYPPTGSAWAQAILAGVPTTARDYDRSYEAIVLAIATNEGLGVNVPQEAAGSKGMSAWKSSRYAKELKDNPKAFAQTLLDHATFGGYPAEQKPGWSSVFNYDPMQMAFYEILYKDLTAKEAMDRACHTIQWATRPPCTSKEWDVKILDDPSNNKGTVNFSWVKGVESICRTDLVTTAQTPLPIQRYLTSTKIYNTSTIGRAVLAISLFGILIELGLIAGFFWYRESEVIKAAAFMPSLIILSGGICTLIAVIMRISFDGKLSWPQCFGTYWLFAIGFSSLLGSLALKSYRIDRIFRSKGRMVAIPNKMLITMIAAVVLGNVIWLLMYQFWIIDDSGQVSQMLPNSAFELVQTDCPKVHKAPTVLLYLYNAAIMVVAAIYAFRTRNVVSSFNESVFTAAAILLITVITIVIIPVLQLVEAAQINLLLIGLGTFLATVLSTLIFAVPKLLMAMGVLHAPSSRETTTVGNNTDIKSSYTTDKKTSATTAPTVQSSVRMASPMKGSGSGQSSDREGRV